MNSGVDLRVLSVSFFVKQTGNYFKLYELENKIFDASNVIKKSELISKMRKISIPDVSKFAEKTDVDNKDHTDSGQI